MKLDRALLKRFESSALLLLEKGFVRTIEFSGPTYQVEVNDEKTHETYWPFLQFNSKGELKDAFCSCEQWNEKEGCLHLATALLTIWGKEGTPIHLRFQKSLWNAMGRYLASSLGYDTSILRKLGKGHYAYDNVFEINGKNSKTKEKISQLIEERRKESEENSLKFSSLSIDEIAKWREGRASFDLLYELSYWSDLAKWLFLMQEHQQLYSLSFVHSKEKLPVGLKIIFPREVEVFLQFDREGLITLVESFSSVDSPLPFYRATDELIDSILYDPGKKEFHLKKIERKSEGLSKNKISLGSYDFIPEVGFFERKSKLTIDKDVITEIELEEFLTEHLDLVKKHLTHYKFHQKKKRIHYDIFFDDDWNLHIKAYLFEKNEPAPHFFGSFAFVENKGFYVLEGVIFKDGHIKVPSIEVSQFVNAHRIFFNEQEGFETHIFPIETSLIYQVTPSKDLKFINPLLKNGHKAEDFGDWVYLKGEGFFSKKKTGTTLKIESEFQIPSPMIPFFIETHKDDLEGVHNFFAMRAPILKRGLRIELDDRERIIITPEYEALEEYRGVELIFFGDYVYIPEEGFYHLSPEFHLPLRFTQKVEIEKSLTSYFLRYEFEGIKTKTLYIDPKLNLANHFTLEIQSLKKNERGGFEGTFYYRTEGGKVSLAEIKKGILEKNEFIFLDKGIIDLENDKLKWISKLKGSFSIEKNTIEFSPLDLMRLMSSESILLPTDETEEVKHTRSLLNEFREFKPSHPPQLKGLKSELRPYQQKGVEWLWFLYSNHLSGLLCDEMGLGKTHQALALIAAISNLKEDARFLVICPTSVIYHWEDKFNRFLPGLHLRIFHRYKRSLSKLPKKGVILTSYGIMRSERETLQNIDFELAVFDEIQAAKNPHSRIHGALSSVKAKMRLGLTGTPIENNLSELKSLFDLVLPTYFPPEKQYKENFIIPIERENNDEKKQLLRSLIHPFILRRKKKEVLEELPDKTVEKGYTELSAEQQELYHSVLKQGREGILKEMKEEKRGGLPYVHIFALISQLKQICDHPALFAKDPQNYKKYSSGKWDLFVELLEEARESEQKVVVFSQYLFMLDIIASYVKEKGWGYAMLRGDTVNRGEEVARFQEDPSCVVFIGSLGAAGVGIDLTAANQVILYDRWWNPARENQAIDRVHRIGQKWGVQVFKLITKNTIEERIDHLVEKKQKLFEEIISADDQEVIKKLSLNELLSLLSL